MQIAVELANHEVTVSSEQVASTDVPSMFRKHNRRHRLIVEGHAIIDFVAFADKPADHQIFSNWICALANEFTNSSPLATAFLHAAAQKSLAETELPKVKH